MDPTINEKLSKFRLCYLPDLKALACETCGFALQPSGISGHLKERHKIYRKIRQSLLDIISDLPLEDPHNVKVLQGVPHTPIPLLTVFKGFRCVEDGCNFLCVAEKRVQQHCSGVHARRGVGGINWQPIQLQTIFRGIYTSYFEVQGDTADASSSSRSPKRPITSTSVPYCLSIQPDSNLADLKLFFHYMTATCHTLRRNSEPLDFWTRFIPQIAMGHSYLMYGLLTIAATHLAHLQALSGPNLGNVSLQFAVLYQDLSLPKFRAAVDSANVDTCAAIIAFSKLLMMQKCASMQMNVPGGVELQLHDVVGYLRLTRANTTMVRSLLHLDTSASMACLLPQGPIIQLRHSMRQPCIFLTPLYMYLNQEHEFCGSMSGAAVTAVLFETFALLQTVYRVAYTTESPTRIWDAIFLWSANLSSAFVDLLERKNSAAILLLGYYCVILGQLQQYWWMKDHGKMILNMLRNIADTSLLHLLADME